MGNPDLHTTGFKTSLDLAQDYGHMSTVTGTKRVQEQRSPYRQSEHTVRSDGSPMSGARTKVDFVRPTLGPQPWSSIKASEIYDLESSPRQISAPTDSLQRVVLRGTPGPTQNPLLSLSHPKYDLPESLVQNFARLRINSIYPWQSSCLLGRGLLTGEKNLVYTAPTGGGKSLVADVLMLKRVIDHPDKRALLVLPYVALVQEKLTWLRMIVEGVQRRVQDVPSDEGVHRASRGSIRSEIRVVGFFGGSKTRATLADVDIAVCTIEKVAPRSKKNNRKGYFSIEE